MNHFVVQSGLRNEHCKQASSTGVENLGWGILVWEPESKEEAFNLM